MNPEDADFWIDDLEDRRNDDFWNDDRFENEPQEGPEDPATRDNEPPF